MNSLWEEKKDDPTFEVLHSPVSTIYSVEEKDKSAIFKYSNFFSAYGKNYYEDLNKSQNLFETTFKKVIRFLTGRGEKSLKILSPKDRKRKSAIKDINENQSEDLDEILGNRINSDIVIANAKEKANHVSESQRGFIQNKGYIAEQQEDCVSLAESWFSHSYYPSTRTSKTSNIKSVSFKDPIVQYLDKFSEEDFSDDSCDSCDSSFGGGPTYLLSSPKCRKKEYKGEQLFELHSPPATLKQVGDDETSIYFQKYHLFKHRLDELDSLLILIDNFRRTLSIK
ncbi:hypothetical protein MDAP_002462 [Mitosporidium daphniae]|uniref:Uncharacterized protein n=1 Tax=Mitosporidium daphniae TaxID=1485682 RepID=A0A098VVP7_9MICR|nr:uncharacterized protein DI09_126p30 [Mitosporidium daphniae]KGG52904.1 hypothetical protein DI09_126p30 [Mitosporidium daphniae]|eukprot:XP_013239340.1 uncharacterized protein DI09_126p30 [Mitosporidium daphniae]